jgi:hypothetical protein
MTEIGKYQNQIPSLSTLDIKSYERIFKVYFESLDDKFFPFYNILKKIEIPELDPSVIDFYDVSTKTPMTTVSYNIYDDINSWWLIYILNKSQFKGPPFWVEGGTRLKYILPELRSFVYLDITQNTIFGGRHF